MLVTNSLLSINIKIKKKKRYFACNKQNSVSTFLKRPLQNSRD